MIRQSWPCAFCGVEVGNMQVHYCEPRLKKMFWDEEAIKQNLTPGFVTWTDNNSGDFQMIKKPKLVYISTPLSKEKFNIIDIEKVILKEGVFAFIPPSDADLQADIGAKVDRMMLDLCDEVWVFGNIGRDCAWEMGYAAALNKPIRIYSDTTHFKNDWMTYLGTDKEVERFGYQVTEEKK